MIDSMTLDRRWHVWRSPALSSALLLPPAWLRQVSPAGLTVRTSGKPADRGEIERQAADCAV